MIVHSILVKPEDKPIKDIQKFTGEYHTEEHKQFIHRRVLQGCKLLEGDAVTFRGLHGVVIDILDDTMFDKVEWNNLECKCIEVYFYHNGESQLYHPNVIKRR